MYLNWPFLYSFWTTSSVTGQDPRLKTCYYNFQSSAHELFGKNPKLLNYGLLERINCVIVLFYPQSLAQSLVQSRNTIMYQINPHIFLQRYVQKEFWDWRWFIIKLSLNIASFISVLLNPLSVMVLTEIKQLLFLKTSWFHTSVKK